MNAQSCLDILKYVKSVAFATIDIFGNPQVRIIDVMIVENEKLYFLTARGKDFYKEITNTHKVGITALNKEYKMIRVNGNVKVLENKKEWISRIFERNPSMHSIYPGDAKDILDPFVIEDAQIEYFDLSKEPIYRETFTIGNYKKVIKVYQISKKCMACGTCKKICPQQTIMVGKPYVIEQVSCLHCGLCVENCPVMAIESRGY